MSYTFELNDIEQAHAEAWIEEHRKAEPMDYTGAIGGRFAYTFIPTSINVVKLVRCTVCDDEEHLTEAPTNIPDYDKVQFSPGFRLKPGDAGRWHRASKAAKERKELYGHGPKHMSTADLTRYRDLLYEESVALQSTEEPAIVDFCERRIRENATESELIDAILAERGVVKGGG
jgi:hypothetical protein